MSTRRFHLHGLFAALLALMANLGADATVPRIDPIAVASVLCHSDGETGGAPSKAPAHHPVDCPSCPLCIALHTPPATLAPVIAAPAPPGLASIVKAELPPPSTAPPAPHRPPSQPRAPPTLS